MDIKRNGRGSKRGGKGYSKHPEHVAVADSKVRPFTASRACLDFQMPC